MSDDPYALLGVTRHASRDEITEAYRALAQIYHPDRYADAPPRVQAEANKRMQALNAAFEEVRRAAGPRTEPPAHTTARRPTAPPRPPPAAAADVLVHYVDGAKGYHHGDVAPLGFGKFGMEMRRVADATQCSKLDAELLQWFEEQRRNAGLAAKQMYSAWSTEEQSSYAAKVGCTQLPREKARAFGVPCPECRP